MTTQTVPRISVVELKDMLDAGKSVMIVDVRGKDSFDAQRIRGAVSMSTKNPTTRWEDLPCDQVLVLY